MSLLNNTKPQAEAKESGVVAGNTVAAAPAAKKSNSEYQKKQRELSKKYGAELKNYFVSHGGVPEELKEVVAFFAREGRASSTTATAFGKPVFYKIFGDAPKVGDKKTALEVFEAVGKGYGEMRQLMKKWLDKQGIEVVFDEVSKSYTIKAGTIPAYNA